MTLHAALASAAALADRALASRKVLVADLKLIADALAAVRAHDPTSLLLELLNMSKADDLAKAAVDKIAAQAAANATLTAANADLTAKLAALNPDLELSPDAAAALEAAVAPTPVDAVNP